LTSCAVNATATGSDAGAAGVVAGAAAAAGAAGAVLFSAAADIVTSVMSAALNIVRLRMVSLLATLSRCYL
jgi:hypothetical protein